ncbi:MAG: hypothetical protein AABO58_18675 [Acidobacteriota bacterium]
MFFFSYASENNSDGLLGTFFEDLCIEVAQHTPWGPKDPRVAFRDQNSLPLMDEWRLNLLEGLQTSAVLVCLTSTAYFQNPNRFGPKEYYIFDQRRRQGLAAGQAPPPVILPVIWVPTPTGLPPAMDLVQWREGDMPALYQTKGLRHLKKLQPVEYDRCVVAFATAIKDAWLTYRNVTELPGVAAFEEIPDPFAEQTTWEEAAGPGGWLLGPGVANFVYAASSGAELPQPPGRYGTRASEWRPYLPPHQKTIEQMARTVAKQQSLKYREIQVSENLPQELAGARNRKNLTIVVADPQTLPMPAYRAVSAFDDDPWDGSAVLMPWDEHPSLGRWEDTLEIVKNMFKIRSQVKTPPFQAPIKAFEDFEPMLDLTLVNLRGAVTHAEAEKKPKTDEPPTQVTGPSGDSKT